MRAMILAAGQGTRLRPLTLLRPKVLAPIVGTAVLDFWIWRLHRFGCEGIVLNAFHLNEKLVAAVQGTAWPIPVEVRVEPVLLGTGGGIRRVLGFFNGEPFAVINGDTVCDAPLDTLYAEHLHSGAPASLLMHDSPAFNNVAVRKGEILGFGGETAELMRGHPDVQCLAFTGIHFINPTILESVSPDLPSDILTVYRGLIREGEHPRALFAPELTWREMGSVESYRRLNAELSRARADQLAPLETGQGVWVHPEAHLEPGVTLNGFNVVGRGCRVGSGVEMENTILWEDVVVEPGCRLNNCIVTDGVRVKGPHADTILTREPA